MNLDNLTDSCPGCMTRGQQPVAWHRPNVETLTCAYTCNNCHMEWECSWWGRED